MAESARSRTQHALMLDPVRVSVLPLSESINTLTNQSVTSGSDMDFTFDEETGVIIDKATGDRCIIFAKARLEHIFLRLTELFQSGAQIIIAESFRAAGKWFIKEIPEDAKTDRATFLAKAIERYKDGGLGRIEIVEFNPDKEKLTFRIRNNLFAEMYHDDSTYCYCVEAYVSGIFEQLIGKPPVIRKTKCLGKGDPYCEWHLNPPAKEE